MRKEGCASWDLGKRTWGGRERGFGTVSVCVRVQESEYGGGGLLVGKFVKGTVRNGPLGILGFRFNKGVNTPRSDEDRLELMELTVFLLPSDEKVRVEEAKEVVDDAKDDQDADVQVEEKEPIEVQEIVEVVTTAKLITKVVTAASTTLTAVDVLVPTATTAAASTFTATPGRRTKGVVIRDPKEELEAELNRTIDWDEAIDHVNKKAKEDPAIKRYQALKRKPQTEAQARKNMMLYLKNVVGFKMDYFKGMSYDDIRPIFEAKFNSNLAFLQKTKEQIKEEESRALKRINETLAEKAAKRQKLDEERTWKLYGVWLRKDLLHQSPRTFIDDFLLITFRGMFKKPDIHAQIWKNQRSLHGPAKVKVWKLLESCGVQIIIFTTTHLILLVDRKYPLTRFTLDQMLNAIRLKVEEESEVSLELLRFIRRQHQEGAQLE
nr:hypothetical protein [Tanacetum cinerariifolium]